jgi:hypothetical protein
MRITRSPSFGALGKSAPQLVRSTPVKTTSFDGKAAELFANQSKKQQAVSLIRCFSP